MNLEKRYNLLKKSGITAISRKLKGYYDVEKQKLVKDDRINAFSRKGLTLKSFFDNKMNALVVLTGERYNRVICIDIDPKGETLELFHNLSETFPEVWEGLWELSMNGGWHFYFRVTNKQVETLKKFKGSNGNPDKKQGLWWDLGLHADVKYNEMVVTSSGYFRYKGETYVSDFCSWSDLTDLPEKFFDAIVKYCVKAEIPDVDKDPEEYNEVINNYQVTEEYDLIRPYIDLMKKERFNSYDSFFRITQIINNCGGTKEDMLEVAKTRGSQSRIEQVHKDYHLLVLGKGCKIGTLHMWVKLDNPTGYKALKKSKESELEFILKNGYSDVACCEAFGKHYGKKLIFKGGKKSAWYIMDDYGIFHFDESNAKLRKMISGLKDVIDEIIETLDPIEKVSKDNPETETRNKYLKSLCDFKKAVTSNRGQSNIISVLESDYHVYDFQVKANYQKLNVIGFRNGVYDLDTEEFRNGVYDLDTEEFRNAKHEEYITKTTGYDFKPVNLEIEMKMEYIMMLLRDILNDDKEIEFILRTLCLGITGSNRHEKIYFHLGHGRNGKGVIQSMMQHTMGDYYGILPYNYFTNSKYAVASAADPHLAEAFGTRYMSIDEGEMQEGLNVAVLKLHSGNSKIKVRDLFESGAKLDVLYKLNFFINKEPNIVVDDDDDALRQRIILIKYPNTFKDAKNIDPKNKFHKLKIPDLKEEIIPKDDFKIAFFHILLRAYQKYVIDGKTLILPPRIERDTKAFLDKNDDLNVFLEENFEITKSQHERESFETFFSKYDKFLKDMGRNTETRTSVIAKLAKLNIPLIKNKAKREFGCLKAILLDMEEK